MRTYGLGFYIHESEAADATLRSELNLIGGSSTSRILGPE